MRLSGHKSFVIPAMTLVIVLFASGAFAMGERKPIEPPVITIGDKPTLVNQAGCSVGGCSGQLCMEAAQAEGMATTCEWREAYACYRSARCERQSNGKCGWTETPTLQACLSQGNAAAK